MTSTEVPLLRRTARVERGAERVAILRFDEEVVLDGVAATLFSKVHPYLDGSLSLGSIAERVEEPPARVAALLEQLRSAGVVVTGSGDGADMSGQDFYRLHRRWVDRWLGNVFGHPLWERITSGQASRAQVLGFAFEKYHYIEGAYEHMAVAAANATPEMMPHLARHFIEEYQHGDIYRKGLSSLFPDAVVVTSQPLPSTRALVNFLRESAATDSFGYYAGNELLQMTENTGDEATGASVDDFYAAMRHHYPYTDRLIESFIAHTRADQKLGHESVFAAICESVPPLTRSQVKAALNVTRSMAEHLVLFLDGVDRFYGNFPALPRRPCDLLSE